jgi:hypothetical protein
MTLVAAAGARIGPSNRSNTPLVVRDVMIAHPTRIRIKILIFLLLY